MARSIGIDLGTTNSVAAQVKKQEAKVVDNQDGESLTPSIVHVTDRGEKVVGKLARAEGGRAPADTVFSIKRFMGREFRDPAIQNDFRRAPYKVVEALNGEVQVILRGRAYSPPEISGFILEAIKRDTEAALDEQVTHAVITVPAYFGSRQREATREAGRLARLNVLRIIPEPTAAALAYGFESDMTESKTVLVYDLGGGTFDVTVMDIAAGVFDDRGKTGDMHLGGDDFDHKIMDWIIDQVRAQHRTDLRALPNASEVLFHLKQKAEEAKIRLARQLRTQIVIPNLAKVGGQFIDIECELTRDQFNRMIQEDVKRSIDLVHEAIHKANVTPNEINAVLLVGGSTRIPLVEDSLRQIFGDRVIRGDVNPMHCVAQGAAIQTLLPISKSCANCHTENEQDAKKCQKCGSPLEAGAPEIECPKCGTLNLAGKMECRQCGSSLTGGIGGILQKIPVPIGVQTEGDVMRVFLDDTMYYPTREPVTRPLKTTRAGQERVRLTVYEGRQPRASENEFLGEARGELPPGLPENTAVTVALSIDEDGILYVTASLPDHPSQRIEARMAWKEREKKAPETGPRKEGPDLDMSDWRMHAQAVLVQLHLTETEAEGLLPSYVLLPLKQLGEQLGLAVQVGDERNARALMAQLEPLLNNLGVFSTLGLARQLAHNPDFAAQAGLEKANKLERAVAEADRQRQMKNGQAMAQVVANQVMPVLNEVIEGSGKTPEDWLRDSSTG